MFEIIFYQTVIPALKGQHNSARWQRLG